jgi:hypothetical protein
LLSHRTVGSHLYRSFPELALPTAAYYYSQHLGVRPTISSRSTTRSVLKVRAVGP